MPPAVSRYISSLSILSGSSSSYENSPSLPPNPPSPPLTGSDPDHVDTITLNKSIVFPLDSLPYLSFNDALVAQNVDKWLSRIRFSCQVCYFLCQSRPIRVVETFPSGRRCEWEDYHRGYPNKCPWRLLYPNTSYDDFRRQVYSTIRLRHPRELEWTICVICEGFYACRADHERNGHDASLIAVAFLVWEDVAIRDHVFSFLHVHTFVPVPDLHSRTDYAVWLGSSACAPWSSLLYLHILVATYDTLRNSELLPLYVFYFYFLDYSHQSHRPSRPDHVEDIVSYRTVISS